MKNTPVFLFLMLVYLSGYGQIKKIYLDVKDHVTTDSIKAVYYVLSEKLDDSAYTVKKFDLQNNLKMKGFYKDVNMNIPHGKFSYYRKYYTGDVFADKVGYFLNGEKSGTWTQFSRPGLKDCSYVYDHGKLNGLCKFYNYAATDMVDEEGNFVNDKREGEWNKYYIYDDTVRKLAANTLYLHDKQISQTIHFKDITIPANFYAVIQKKLKAQMDTITKNQISVRFRVNTDGTTADVRLSRSISPAFDAKVINAFLSVPGFKPASFDNIPVVEWGTTGLARLTYFDDLNNQSRLKGFANHADLIGRGLNFIGVGEKLDKEPDH